VKLSSFEVQEGERLQKAKQTRASFGALAAVVEKSADFVSTCYIKTGSGEVAMT